MKQSPNGGVAATVLESQHVVPCGAQQQNLNDANGKVDFIYQGRAYRTNADASIVEARDAGVWTRTFSSNARRAALRRLAKAVQS